jgi:endonuclease I
MKKFLYFLFFLPALAMAQTSLPAFWNFSTPGIATPPNGWITGLGTNGNLTYSGGTNSSGGDGIACRLDASGEYLTIWFADKPGPVSYWLRGTGINPNPSFTGIFSVQESTDGNAWTAMKTFTTADPAPGSMTRYENQPATASRYVRFFYTTKESGSNIALDSVLIKTAPANSTATINLKKGTENVINNTTYIVGNTAATVFTIENKGTSEALNISSINITGAQASAYSITGAPTTVAANGSATFTLNFSSALAGSNFGTMTINSNDAEKSAYKVDLYGISGPLASEPTRQVSEFAFSNVKPYSFNCTFSLPFTIAAEHYIVLRKKGGNITEAPVDGHTYLRGDYIGNAQVAYIGSGASMMFKPSYITANSDYQFAVFSFNGPPSFENYLAANPRKANITTPGSNPGSYYFGINQASTNFVSSLSQKINPHDTVFYSQYIGTVINNFLTRDTIAGKKAVTCVYTGNVFVYEEPFLWWTGTNNATLTREHTYAQSWMPSNAGSATWPNDPGTGKELPEFNDLHHLFPADQEIGNVKRSNLPFGEVVNVTYVSPTGQGKIGTDINGKTVYEPRNEQKGDLARAMFYMCTAYNGINGKNWALSGIAVAQQDEAVLKKWHFQDLPDAYEIARHEYIASLQHNRNPFIDSVNFVCRINFTNMSWIATPDVNCGAVVTSLTLTSPVGGELFSANQPNTITWTSSMVDSVKIELFMEDTFVMVIAESVSATPGVYVWATENVPHQTTSAKIKVSHKSGAPASMSPDYFRLLFPDALEEIFSSADVSLYPNPSAGTVSIDITKSGIRSATIIITDITGRIISETTVNGTHASVEPGQRGIYFIKIQAESGSVVKKVIID